MYFDRYTPCTSSADQNFALFHVASFLRLSQWRVPVPELGINSSKPYRIFKSPLMSLMIGNNGRNKLFLMCKSISSKGGRAKHSQNQGTYFIGVHPSPVLMKLDARKCIILSCLFIRLKDEAVFSCFSVFTFVQNEWLATNSQNAILNNSEEYYINFRAPDKREY